MRRNHLAMPRRHSNAARQHDLYETPPQAVHALMRVERLPYIIWEPACGRGAIVNVLRQAGHLVGASDLIDYGWDGGTPGINFLRARRRPGVDCILTNPPYKHATAFVAHALKLCPSVIMLLRLAFLEGTGRSDLLEHSGLARVHVFRNRLPMMHRDGWTGPRASSAVAFAWFVFDRFHSGPPTLHRISWE